ncbi:Hypothetical predicted protein [Podarcis lilfordi]|uniref:Uncharacterized protein n=1 Tax=Podarcis lilfordi TaxID=74358 RepID=A0AA35LI17_9SAUR|nr:Hypothetical predicted protein [Podarcis lilfordi]
MLALRFYAFLGCFGSCRGFCWQPRRRLQAKAFVWVNGASAHSQSVAKAKYEFLFGGSENENISESGSHGGSTLLPHNINNEFPEYGAVEEGAKTSEMPSEVHEDELVCVSEGQPCDQLPSENGRPSDKIEFFSEGLQMAPQEEEVSEPFGRPSETIETSQDLESEKALDRENDAFGSEMQMEKERKAGSGAEEAAREMVLAGQEKPPEMPLPSEATAERKLYWIAEEDSMVLTVEIQPETLRTAGGATEEAHKICETSCHKALAQPEDRKVGASGVLGGAWADFEREFSVFDSDKEERAPERRISKEAAVSKHVEFQGVEILWIQKAEEQKETGLSDTDSVERRFSKHHPPPAVSSELDCLPERSWNVSWGNFRPLTSLAEGGEDEVFIVEEKKNGALERKSMSDKDRLMEEEEDDDDEAISGRVEDVLGQPHSEVSTDVYSSQFESILDNASLYYSAESLETLYSEPDSYFSFEMPLTPMIQQRIKEDAQFLERTPDGAIRKGHSGGIANGLGDVKETDITEACHLESMRRYRWREKNC